MSALVLESGSTVGVFDAKTHLSELLALVEQGEEITITRHGKAVAKLIPAVQSDPINPSGAYSGILQRFLDKTQDARLGPELSLQALIQESRR